MLTAFAVIVPMFFEGNASGHDFEFHVNSWMEVTSQWKEGILYPRWADWAQYGYGEARFIFYPPASWLIGAALGEILPWRFVPPVYIWLVLTLSGCTMFTLARRWLEPTEAIFAAALYAANPYYLVVVYWRSAYAELFAGALLPLLLLYVLRLAKEGRSACIPLALIVAAAWLCNAPAAVMVTYSLVLLMVVMAVVRRSASILLYGMGALAVGLALSAFYILPATYEQKWVDISQVLSPGVRPQDNFLFTTLPDPDHNRFNRLVSLVAASQIAATMLAGLWFGRWRQRLGDAWWALVLWAAAAILFMLPFTLPLWNLLPKLRFVQFPWRWLMPLGVPFALLVTMAWRRWLARLAVCAALLAVVVFCWNRILPPWWDNALDIAEMQRNISEATGYEGTDEYVPLGADSYEIHRDARRATMEGPGTDQIRVVHWGPELKAFTADVSRDANLTLRLFNYPAWRVTVNGHEVQAGTREVTGQMMVPVTTGDNRVVVRFTRTWDRTAGGILSSVVGLLLLGVSLFRRHQPFSESPASP